MDIIHIWYMRNWDVRLHCIKYITTSHVNSNHHAFFYIFLYLILEDLFGNHGVFHQYEFQLRLRQWRRWLCSQRERVGCWKVCSLTHFFHFKLWRQNQGNLDWHGNPSWFSGLQDESNFQTKISQKLLRDINKLFSYYENLVSLA